MSVRSKPEAHEVAAAEDLYRRFREGKAGDLAFHKGIVVRTGLMRWASLFQLMPVRWCIRLAAALMATAPFLAALAAGVSGLPLAAVAGGLLAGGLLGAILLEARVASPLAAILAQAQAVASGHAGRNVTLNRVDEIGLLLRAINQIGLSQRTLVNDVDERALSVDRSSIEIAQGNYDLSARTEQQASALEETAAARS